MKERTQRCQRIGDQLRSEIAKMLLREIKDPRIGFVTIMDVEVAPDLGHATVFFTVYGSDEELKNTLAGLNSTASFMRREMGRRLHLKRIPQLHFRFDKTTLKGEHLEGIFSQIRNEEEN
ncbi:MAG TPA: 30S ribosome-binding factor RbfA [Desulfarculaceae bacterium]|nr:30S ribosome-binding factor RbfA [Desulfarculaceae bacterium]